MKSMNDLLGTRSLLDLLIKEQELLKELVKAEETNDYDKRDSAERNLNNVRIEIKFYIMDMGFDISVQ